MSRTVLEILLKMAFAAADSIVCRKSSVAVIILLRVCLYGLLRDKEQLMKHRHNA